VYHSWLQVSATVKSFMAKELQSELIELLEKIVLQNSAFRWECMGRLRPACQIGSGIVSVSVLDVGFCLLAHVDGVELPLWLVCWESASQRV
jgi:hypothetical protein